MPTQPKTKNKIKLTSAEGEYLEIKIPNNSNNCKMTIQRKQCHCTPRTTLEKNPLNYYKQMEYRTVPTQPKTLNPEVYNTSKTNGKKTRFIQWKKMSRNMNCQRIEHSWMT